MSVATYRALDTLAGFHETVNERLLQGVSDTEVAALFSMLERVIENAQDYAHDNGSQ